jgi:hypothetical protein
MTPSMNHIQDHSVCTVIKLRITMLNVIMLNVIMLNVIILNVVMLNVVMLNDVMLNVIMLNVIMLNVVLLRVIILSVVGPFSLLCRNKLDCLFLTSLSSLVQYNKEMPGAYPSEEYFNYFTLGQAPALFTNIRPSLKAFSETNTLAYYKNE